MEEIIANMEAEGGAVIFNLDPLKILHLNLGSSSVSEGEDD